MVQDLHLVSRLLEFVASRSRKVTEYGKLLDRMLHLCKLRPILEKSSDLLRCNDALESYFSTLGHLTRLLDTDREILTVLEAVSDLSDESRNNNKLSIPPSLNLEICHEAIQKSTLPIFLTELLRDSSPDVYGRTLDVVLVIVTISIDCCKLHSSISIKGFRQGDPFENISFSQFFTATRSRMGIQIKSSPGSLNFVKIIENTKL